MTMWEMSIGQDITQVDLFGKVSTGISFSFTLFFNMNFFCFFSYLFYSCVFRKLESTIRGAEILHVWARTLVPPLKRQQEFDEQVHCFFFCFDLIVVQTNYWVFITLKDDIFLISIECCRNSLKLWMRGENCGDSSNITMQLQELHANTLSLYVVLI